MVEKDTPLEAPFQYIASIVEGRTPIDKIMVHPNRRYREGFVIDTKSQVDEGLYTADITSDEKLNEALDGLIDAVVNDTPVRKDNQRHFHYALSDQVTLEVLAADDNSVRAVVKPGPDVEPYSYEIVVGRDGILEYLSMPEINGLDPEIFDRTKDAVNVFIAWAYSYNPNQQQPKPAVIDRAA